MRILVILVIAVMVGAVAGVLIARQCLTNQMNAGVSHTATAPILKRVRHMATLVTIRLPVNDVQTSQLSGTIGAARLILIAHGDVEVGVDLGRAELHDVDRAAHRATLVMPEPELHRPRLNHERTRIYELDRSGLWQLVPGHEPERHLIDSAFRRAQRLLAAWVDQAEVRADARRLSTQIITGLLADSGWRIDVRWTDR